MDLEPLLPTPAPQVAPIVASQAPTVAPTVAETAPAQPFLMAQQTVKQDGVDTAAFSVYRRKARLRELLSGSTDDDINAVVAEKARTTQLHPVTDGDVAPFSVSGLDGPGPHAGASASPSRWTVGWWEWSRPTILDRESVGEANMGGVDGRVTEMDDRREGQASLSGSLVRMEVWVA